MPSCFLPPRPRAKRRSRGSGGTLDDVFGERVITCELSPGQALFVPVGWVHEVTALDPSITLSCLNFPWPNHFHWLGPAGSDDEARGGAPW